MRGFASPVRLRAGIAAGCACGLMTVVISAGLLSGCSSPTAQPTSSPSSPVTPTQPSGVLPSPGVQPPSGVQRIALTYRAWDGAMRTVVLLLPNSYHQGSSKALPVVISPHGRDEDCFYTARHWGTLPTLYDFAVVCPEGEGHDQGARLGDYSYACPGQVSDLMNMPAYVQKKLPWVHFDFDRVYAAGDSMGGLEVLALLARYPDRLAAVAAMDGVADLAARYSEMRTSASSADSMADLVSSVGGTPAKAPFQYAIRSPLYFARTLAFSHVPLQIWWSRTDAVVIDQATHQTGLLYRRIKALNPTAPVTQVVHSVPHGYEFSQKTGLTQVVRFFRDGGRWLRRQTQPPHQWSYSSWLPSGSVWGHRFDAAGINGAVWQYFDSGRRLSADSPVPLDMYPPKAEAPTAVLKATPGVALRRAAGGSSMLVFPRGASSAMVN
jgi:pimeloyl-ACP methyl ester carboxylesterase